MTGAVSPAWAATSEKLARNGIPEGLHRGCGLTPREAMPWAIAMVEDAAAISRNWRRLNCSRGVAGIGIDGPSFNYEEPGESPQTQLASWREHLSPLNRPEPYGVCKAAR